MMNRHSSLRRCSEPTEEVRREEVREILLPALGIVRLRQCPALKAAPIAGVHPLQGRQADVDQAAGQHERADGLASAEEVVEHAVEPVVLVLKQGKT